MIASRPSLRGIATAVGLAVIAWFVVRALAAHWSDVLAATRDLHPRWPGVVIASAIVLSTHALLIQSWRGLLRGWGGRLAYGDAVRIWTVSNLARFVPGTLWSVGVMGVLARRTGVAPAAAGGAAILNTLLNLAAGFAVVTLVSGDVVTRLAPQVRHAPLIGATLGAAGLVILPFAVPALTGIAARVLRRAPPPRIPAPFILAAFAANVVAWLAYGVAFGCFARAVLPNAGDNWAGFVAVFTGAYVIGFLAILTPGGLGVREGAMVVALTRLGMASAADAVVLAVAARLWLTLLEVAPGVAFLAVTGARARRAAARPV